MKMKEVLINGTLTLLKVYLWAVLIPFGLFGFFIED